uniref:tripartite motif-containing protein 60-like n=1 Tax=Jaculus jaculus TaxID=51337 RepID=UPI001E1B3C15|nr:tripartite motif-containing protein 60-like [Jaculus jaculus]
MELAADLAELQAEASCPVCHEYFTNPVTITCGHNFCLSCIRASWEGLQGSFPCPSCHFHCPEKDFSSNHQLANLTEAAKLLPIRRSKRKRREGGQKELEALCLQCSLPSTRTQHPGGLLARAALCGPKQFQRYVELWGEKVEPVEKAITMQKRKSLELKKMVERKRGEMESEFDQLRLFLQNEHKRFLRQLEDEGEANSAKLNRNLTTVSDHASALEALLREVQGRSDKPERELLDHVKTLYHRFESLKCPETFSFKITDYGHQLLPQFSGLNIIIQQFKVDVTLDPKTAHHKLTISEDRKTVRYGKMRKVSHSPRRFYSSPAVLGSQGYHSGRQYWEVDVSSKPAWILGVCVETFPRRSHVRHRQDEIWGVGRYSQTVYAALGPKKMNILPKVTPSKIGIFLDSEIGEVSFYNLNDQSLLCTFNDCRKGALWPYFNTSANPKPLRICTVTS